MEEKLEEKLEEKYEENEVYRPRLADVVLKEQLEAAGMILVQGAKWCGKTTTARQQAKSVLYMNDPSMQENIMHLAASSVGLLLEGATPRLIDEWQLVPQLWDAARIKVDRRGKDGQFIFTGYAVITRRDKITHTGTGRAAWITMRPMSLWESGESNGKVSLEDVFEGRFQQALADGNDLQHMAFLLCRGGWPKAVGRSEKAALRQAYNYVDAVATQEIMEVDDVRRDEQSTRKLLRSYARHQASQASVATIVADMRANEATMLSENTVASYLQALRMIFVVEDMEAWNPNLRSKSAIRTSDTRYFVDPSIATAALRIGPKDLLRDMQTFGLLFETMAVRDLRVYAEVLDGKVYHFRDSNGLECDAVLHRNDGSYGLIEVKIGGEKYIEEGARNLKLLASKIDTDRMPAPAFMMVLTAVGAFAYRREDGVLVVPIRCLKN